MSQERKSERTNVMWNANGKQKKAKQNETNTDT